MPNIFVPNEVPVVTTNCVGVMGAGIAKQARELYPGLELRYKRALKEGTHGLGRPCLIGGLTMLNMDGPQHFNQRVLLFATKDHYKDPSRIEWIEEGLARFVAGVKQREDLQALKYNFPPLGCGLGGLDFNEVYPLMKALLSKGVPRFTISGL